MPDPVIYRAGNGAFRARGTLAPAIGKRCWEVSEAIAQQRDLRALFHDLATRLHSVVEFDFPHPGPATIPVKKM